MEDRSNPEGSFPFFVSNIGWADSECEQAEDLVSFYLDSEFVDFQFCKYYQLAQIRVS